MNNLYLKEIAKQFIIAIKEEKSPFQKSWDFGELTKTAPRNYPSGKVYQGLNSLYLRLAGYNNNLWLTISQAQNFGAKLRQDELAKTIQFVQFEEIRNLGLQETINLDKPKLFLAKVFNLEQFENFYPFLIWGEDNLNHNIERILHNSQAVIKKSNTDNSFYHPKKDYISIADKNSFADERAYFSKILLELCRWTGHSFRLNRNSSAIFGSKDYAKEELKVSLAYFLLAQTYGLSYEANTINYENILDNTDEMSLFLIDSLKIYNYLKQFDK